MCSGSLDLIKGIVVGTPWWVWAIFAYVTIVGIRATKTYTLPLPILFILPAVLIGMKYKVFLTSNYLPFLIALTIGLFIGFFIGKKTPLKIFKSTKSVEVPGNYHTLVILLAFFAAKYVFGYLESTQPSRALEYAFVDISLSGLFAGFFLGRSLAYLYKFYDT